jgi:hypothetical protein
LVAAVLGAGAVLLWRGVALPDAAVRAVERQVGELRGGKPVSVGRLHLILVDGALRLRAEGVRSLTGPPETRASPVQADFAFSPRALLQGRLGLQRADLAGGDITITVRRSGETAVAFGRPGAEPDLVLAPPEQKTPLALRARQLLDAAAQALQAGAAHEQLQRLRITRAQLIVVDEASGGIWKAQDARLDLRRRGEQLDLRAGATLLRDGAPARLAMVLQSDTALRSAHLELELEDALLRLFSGQNPMLDAVQAPLQVRLEADVDRTVGLQSLGLRASSGAGRVRLGGEDLAIDSLDLAGRYTLAGDVLELDRLRVAGRRLQVEGSGSVRNLARLLTGAAGEEPLQFAADMPVLRLTSKQFEAPLELQDFALVGAYQPAARAWVVDSAGFRIGAAYAGFGGALYWDPDVPGGRPGLRGAATLAGEVTAADVRALWPAALAPSARSWFFGAMKEARLGQVEARVDVTPKDWGAGPLPDRALEVSFPVSDAVVQILSGMEPLRQGRGRVRFHGSALDVEVEEAMLGRVRLLAGSVSAPRLSREGAVTISTESEGDARAYIDLLLQTPLDIRERLPFEPASIVGAGAVRLTLTRPLRGGVSAADVDFDVEGRLAQVGAVSRKGDLRVSDWSLALSGDGKGMRFAGPLRIGDSRAELLWQERFGDAAQVGQRSRYTIKGELLTKELDLLGVPARGVAQGSVTVEAEGEGDGLAFSQLRLNLDLTKASLTLPPELWSKPAGRPAQLTATLARAEDGGVLLRAFDASGPGLRARGSAHFGPDGRLIALDAAPARLGAKYDVALKAWRSRDSGLVMEAEGALFDATPFLPQGRSTTEARAPVAKSGASLDLRVKAEKLLLREDSVVSGAAIRVVMLDGKLDRWLVSGRDPGGGALSASMTPADRGAQRDILLQSQDVGFALRALIGKNPIQGGEGRISGQWSPKDRVGVLQMRVEDFKIVDLPLAAKLFSSVASLQGLSNLVSNEGLAFSSLDGAFRIENDIVRLRDAQAVGGSIGITASGVYNMKTHAIEADGVLVPAYRLNSALGEIPGIGRLFTSRKGEGVFGFTYAIRGDVERARIAVNPLSAFAPGIFRRVFEPTDHAARAAADAPTP